MRILPESRFIHLIRDGRDISLSIAPLWFGPDGRNPEDVALWWITQVTKGREEGSRVKHYMELKYEELVLDTERSLRRVADFVELPWDRRMFDYHQTARERMAELRGSRRTSDGQSRVSPEAGQQIHTLTARPPLTERVGLWRSEMAPEDLRRFREIAGVLLEDLGYD